MTKNSYIEILLQVLQGKAYTDVYDMNKRNAGLKEILDTMTHIYCKKKDINDEVREINKFKRLPEETIMATMSRAKLLVHRVKSMYPNETRKNFNEHS